MTPDFNRIFKPDSLRKSNSFDCLHEGVFGAKYPTGHLLRKLERWVKETTVLKRFGFND